LPLSKLGKPKDFLLLQYRHSIKVKIIINYLKI